jgi:hypothetical protein
VTPFQAGRDHAGRGTEARESEGRDEHGQTACRCKKKRPRTAEAITRVRHLFGAFDGCCSDGLQSRRRGSQRFIQSSDGHARQVLLG